MMPIASVNAAAARTEFRAKLDKSNTDSARKHSSEPIRSASSTGWWSG